MTRVLWLRASRPLFLHRLEYFKKDFMSSCGDRTSERTWRIFCQSSTTRWQPYKGYKSKGKDLFVVFVTHSLCSYPSVRAWVFPLVHDCKHARTCACTQIHTYSSKPHQVNSMQLYLMEKYIILLPRNELTLFSSLTWSLFHQVLLIASLRSGTSLNWIISSSSDSICTLTIAWE